MIRLKDRHFVKFTGKHLCQSLFLKKRLWHRCFPVNFVKFLRTPFFIEHLWWLLLERNYVVKDLLNPGSQQTYISQRIADRLNFTPINQRNMSVKTFGTD